MNIKEIRKELYCIIQKSYDIIDSVDVMEQEEKPLLTDEEKEILKNKIKEIEKVTGHFYYAISIQNQPVEHIRFYHNVFNDYYDAVTGYLCGVSSLKVNVKYDLKELGID